MLRRQAIALGAAAGFTLARQARAEMPVQFRIGLIGGENTQDRLARYEQFQQLLSEHLRIPVKLYPGCRLCRGHARHRRRPA